MGSGGGGSSGKVDYPAYMTAAHGSWLNHGGADTVTSSMVDLINANLTTSPYATASPYDSEPDVLQMWADAGAATTAVTSLAGDDLGTLVSTTAGWVSDKLLTDAMIDAIVSAHSAQVQDELDDDILPAYRTGMRDVGMVNTSAFAIGEAILASRKLKSVASVDAELRKLQGAHRLEGGLKFLELANNSELEKARLLDAAYKLRVEVKRMSIVAGQEYADKEVEYDELNAKWPFDMYGYAGNLLASISGAAIQGGSKGPSKMASALGGALSGAAAGAMMGAKVGAIGGPMGAALGGAVGLLGGLL